MPDVAVIIALVMSSGSLVVYRQLCARDQRQAAGKESRDTGFPSRGHQSPESSALRH